MRPAGRGSGGAAALTNPYVWHFAFHAIPDLPETLVAEHLPEYLDFFFDVITAQPGAITPEARRRYVQAYSTPATLARGSSSTGH